MILFFEGRLWNRTRKMKNQVDSIDEADMGSEGRCALGLTARHKTGQDYRAPECVLERE
jgi:hypothetical protein